MKIMVTTHPFGKNNNLPIKMLSEYEVHYNDVYRKYSREEHLERIKKINPDIIIAGTEKYDYEIFNLASNLKMISRVGIGLDSIPLEECKKRGIIVSYTPDAPSNAVAELTICQMINMLRRVQFVDNDIRNGKWSRYIGKELRDCNVGIIGCGRIGGIIINKMQGLKPRKLFVNDINHEKCNLPRCEFATKFQILSSCDIISLHIPLNDKNINYIDKEELSVIKDDAILLNMSRGGIINEESLLNFLQNNKKACAALDTFYDEPYNGPLKYLDNCYLTPHLGSCTDKSRYCMEVGAVEQALCFINNKDIENRVL